MRKDLLTLLSQTDTPTICNAIELARGKRGGIPFTHKPMVALHNSPRVAMGFARTAQIAGAVPSTRTPEENEKMRLTYYKYMSEGTRPAVCVIEDLDAEPVAAFWGELNTNIHRGFGISGTLTNGVIRDFGFCPEDYQVIGGCVGPSHEFVHVRAVGTAVNIHGMEVKDGDFIHADRHGACVIPLDVLDGLDGWIKKMQDAEAFVITAANRPDFNFEKLVEAWDKMKKTTV